MTPTALRAYFVRTPQDYRDALVGLGLSLAEPLFTTAARARCERMLHQLHDDDHDTWARMMVHFLRGVGVQLEDTILGTCAVKLGALELLDAHDRPPLDVGAWLGPPGGELELLGTVRWHWGDVSDDSDESQLVTAGIDPAMSRAAAACAAATCIDTHALHYVVSHIGHGSVATALRHLVWSARAIGRLDGAQLAALAVDVAVASPLDLSAVDDRVAWWWNTR